MKALIILLLLSGCSQWYLVNKVEIHKKDIPAVRKIVSDSEWNATHKLKRFTTDEYIIRRIQYALAYDNLDLAKAVGGSFISGLGLGAKESHDYGYGWDGLSETNSFRKWATMNTAGNAWMKIGHFDKVARSVYMFGDRYGWNKWIRYFGGNWVWAYLAHFAIQNSTAGLVRNFAKHGTPFYWNIEFDLQIIEKIFD